MSDSSVNYQHFFELGKLYAEKGDFTAAIKQLNQAKDGFYSKKEFDQYLECQNLLLRIYVERMEYNKVTEIKEHLQDMVLNKNIELSAKTYYVLGVCASHKEQHETSLEYCQKSLQIALAKDSKEDICHAILGIAICYYNLNRLQEALKEIYNLNVFFEVINIPVLQASKQILNGNIFKKMGRYDEAIEVYNSSYDILRAEKNLWMHVRLLYAMGVTYQESGDNNLARTYLQLAAKLVDADNFAKLSKGISVALKTLGVSTENEYDLVFDRSANYVIERKRGRVEFKNQFILLDLLQLFLQNPGKVFSKEDLVNRVWRQEYNPSVHDNKIYVTIKRLRKLIEPDYEKPKYVFRAKNGYYLNKATKFLLEH